MSEGDFWHSSHNLLKNSCNFTQIQQWWTVSLYWRIHSTFALELLVRCKCTMMCSSQLPVYPSLIILQGRIIFTAATIRHFVLKYPFLYYSVSRIAEARHTALKGSVSRKHQEYITDIKHKTQATHMGMYSGVRKRCNGRGFQPISVKPTYHHCTVTSSSLLLWFSHQITTSYIIKTESCESRGHVSDRKISLHSLLIFSTKTFWQLIDVTKVRAQRNELK